LPPLTDDIRKVRVMSNKSQRAQGMEPRSEREIPLLMANAKEIISMLQQEYPVSCSLDSVLTILLWHRQGPALTRTSAR
jgi:hypothetical protein